MPRCAKTSGSLVGMGVLTYLFSAPETDAFDEMRPTGIAKRVLVPLQMVSSLSRKLRCIGHLCLLQIVDYDHWVVESIKS